MKKRLGAFVGAGLLLVARGSRSWLRGHETKSIAPPDDHVDVLESWLPDISAPRVPAKTEAPSAVVSEPEKIPETATGQRPAAAGKPRSPISTVSGTCGKEVFVALDASYYVTEAVLRTALAAEDRECIEPTIQVGTIKIAAEATDEGFQSKEAAAEHNAKISGLQVARFATKLDIDTVLRLFFLNSDPRSSKTAIFPTLKDDAQAAFEAREMVQLTLREDLRLKKLQTPAASPGTAPQVVQGDISGDSDSNIVQVIVDSGFAEVPRQLEFVLAPPSEQNFQEKASVQQALVLVEKQGEYGDAVGYVWNEVNKRKFENLITKTVDVFLESEAAAAEEEKKQEEAALAAAADAAQEVENGGTAGSTGGGAPAGSAAGGGANSTTATAAGGAANGKANKASLVEIGVKNKMKSALVPPPTSSSFSAPNLISGGRGRKIENGGGGALQSVRGGTATSTTSGQKKQVPSSTAIEESSSVARSAGAQPTNTRDDGPSIQRRTEPQKKDQSHHVPESAYWPILEIAGFAVLADLLLLICCNDPATSYRRGSSSSSRDYFYLHGNTDRSSNVSTGLPSGSGSNRSGGNNNNNWRRGGVESSKGTTMVEASVQTSSSAEEQSEPSGRRGEPETVNPEQSRGSA